LLTTERTPTLNIEWGQINPKAGGGCNIDSGQNDKATQGLKGQFTPKTKIHLFPLTCAIDESLDRLDVSCL